MKRKLRRQLEQGKRRILERLAPLIGGTEPKQEDQAVSPPEEATDVRVRDRKLESEFGRVVVWRHGFKAPGESAARFPMDEQLNLPPDLYSHSLRERVVDEARREAWDQAVEQVDKRTGGHVPKRQAEELAVHITQDFEAFYEQRGSAQD